MKRAYLLAVTVLLAACSGGSGDNSGNAGGTPATPSASSEVNSVLKILAENVIIGTAQAADGVDTTTKILASNVVLDNKSLGTSATNLQDLLNELVPDLNTSLVGTWTGQTLTRLRTFAVSITFNGDHTYTCSGDATFIGNSAINPTHLSDQDTICQHPTSWELVGPHIIKLISTRTITGCGAASTSSSGDGSDPAPPAPCASATTTEQLFLPIIVADTTHLQVLLGGDSGGHYGAVVANLQKSP